MSTVKIIKNNIAPAISIELTSLETQGLRDLLTCGVGQGTLRIIGLEDLQLKLQDLTETAFAFKNSLFVREVR